MNYLYHLKFTNKIFLCIFLLLAEDNNCRCVKDLSYLSMCLNLLGVNYQFIRRKNRLWIVHFFFRNVKPLIVCKITSNKWGSFTLSMGFCPGWKWSHQWSISKINLHNLFAELMPHQWLPWSQWRLGNGHLTQHTTRQSWK